MALEASAPAPELASYSFYQCADRGGWYLLDPQYYDLSPCVVQGLLMGILGVGSLLAGLHQVSVLYRKKITSANRVSPFFYVKLGLVLIQIIFQLNIRSNYPKNDLIGTVLNVNLASTIVVLAIHYLENFKVTIPNAVVLFYWFFTVVLNLFKILNLYVRSKIHTNSGVFTILMVVNAFLILVIELLVPIKSLVPLKDAKRISPYDRANIFSKITFVWMGELIQRGYYKFLTEKDLPPLPKELKATTNSDIFYKNWYCQNTPNPSILIALVKSFGAHFAMGSVFKFTQDCLAFVQPQLLRLLIQFVNDYSQAQKTDQPLPLTKGFMIAGGMFLVSVIQTSFLHQYFQVVFDVGMKIKSSLVSVIYNKSMVLSSETKQESNTGDIVNLMSVDVQRLQETVSYLQIGWSGPFQIFLCLFSLHGLVGNAMWAGVAIMVVMIPFNSKLATYQKALQKTQMKHKDARSRLTSEILNNIKSLKLYGWEEAYLEKLNYIRNEKELKNLQRIGVFMSITVMIWNFAPVLVSCCTFALYIVIEKDKPLSTDIVFPALALFNLLGFPLAVVPQVISNVTESQVALGRLHKFLHGSELQPDAIIRLPKVEEIGQVAVSIEKGNFLWSKPKDDKNNKVALSNINLSAKKGHLDCIVGKVGSGKSSIIQAILGDLYKLQGEVKVHGSIAYVAQVPWIMNGSIKENILFGHRYDPEFYQHVLKACALTVDLKILSKGDETLVGEKGISLSGGQKARVSLARAVYARSDVYLIDDALSAVDEHVGKHLIDHVLGPKGLLKSKCKILATNNIGVLSIADNMHMVADGKIVENGSYDEIQSAPDSKLFHLIKDFGKAKEQPSEEELNEEAEKQKSKSQELLVDDEVTDIQLESEDELDVQSLSGASLVTLDESLEDELDAKEEDDEELAKRKEHFEQGKVKWDVYLQYAKACNPKVVCIWIGVIVFNMWLNVASSLWLKYWSEVNTGAGYNPDVPFYLGIYLLLGFINSLSILAQNCIVWIYCTIKGSSKLHNLMAIAVLRAPMSFFETTPIGRVLNRFSSDVYKVDEVLCRVFGMFFSNSFKAVFSIMVICFSTWQFIFLVGPLVVFYVMYQQYYLRSSRELRRLDSISRSPIYANFQESLTGVNTIRAYNEIDRFRYINELRIDKNMRAYHPSVNSNRWLAVRLEFFGSIIILGAAGFAIFALKSGSISAGLVGLSVSYSLQITQTLNWIVRMTVEVETNIVSVERILEYSRLDSEAPEVIEEKKPGANWPQSGQIEFNNYSTRYRPDLDLVLKNINLSIKSHEKVGIVGRTGAGKSSLTLALFRIIEAAEGNITIDEINTSVIGLKDLRQRLSIIPQDSQVFEGSIRSNLDPFAKFSDDAVWRALELSHLKDHVLKMFEEYREQRDSEEEVKDEEEIIDPLEVKLTEGGSNLSVGQRQLMCLARALLIPSHILVLDEATAAVDVETDKVLQQTIRAEFKDRTILTIAHRINTILDSDKIIVLEKGEVAEFDSPENLLKKKDSLFYSLCKQGGFVKDE
ncbi:hypothetical protein CANTEDRAFT_111013 [Yamadazyma tenuis ATCC 10573]|nr:uncharacterized protein CANTEDRAFT_111013 [Yamadazyma tenuis ATCC 10573]EGV60205.1 hypothetical protein CANTEDRAFT_111013 [Yamadazyma tenuis ATCC 10573]